MKIVCEWCEVVLLEVQNLETDKGYVTTFICESCCQEVFEEGTMAGIPKAYALIESILY